jgi:hypothetical protein
MVIDSVRFRYADHPIGNLPVPKGPDYNWSAQGYHAFLPEEPTINAAGTSCT